MHGAIGALRFVNGRKASPPPKAASLANKLISVRGGVDAAVRCLGADKKNRALEIFDAVFNCRQEQHENSGAGLSAAGNKKSRSGDLLN